MRWTLPSWFKRKIKPANRPGYLWADITRKTSANPVYCRPLRQNLWRFPRIPKTTFWPFLPFERKYKTRRESFVYRLVCLPIKLSDFNVLLRCQSVCQSEKNIVFSTFFRNLLKRTYFRWKLKIYYLEKCGMGFKFDHQFKEQSMKLETLTNSSGHPVRSFCNTKILT